MPVFNTWDFSTWIVQQKNRMFSNMSLCDLWLNHADSAYGSLIQDKQLWRSCCFSPTMKKGQKNSTPFLLFPRQTGLSHIFTGNRHTVTQSLVEKWKQWKRTPSLCSRLMNCGCFFSVGIPELWWVKTTNPPPTLSSWLYEPECYCASPEETAELWGAHHEGKHLSNLDYI